MKVITLVAICAVFLAAGLAYTFPGGTLVSLFIFFVALGVSITLASLFIPSFRKRISLRKVWKFIADAFWGM